MIHRSLYFRLLLVILIGMVTLAAADHFTNQWMIAQVRDRAIADSTNALYKQAITSLQRQVQRRAETSSQTISSIKLITATASNLIAEGWSEKKAEYNTVLLTNPQGWRYQQATTTVLVPPGDNPQADIDLSVSTRMNSVFPSLVQAFPEVDRISYLATSGVFRTFPQLDWTQLPDSLLPAQNPAYQAIASASGSNSAIVWLPPHSAIDSSDQVISAVAPVYMYAKLIGVVIVDIDLNTVARPIQSMGAEFSGFGFVIDSAGHPIIVPSEGQSLLFGRTLQAGDLGALTIGGATPALQPLMDAVQQNQTDALTVPIQNNSYIIVHQPIPELSWSVSIIVPTSQIAAATGSIAQGITDAASAIQGRGLLAAILLVLILCALIALVLLFQFSRPLSKLVSATNAIAAGELSHVAVVSDNELGMLAHDFNQMIDAVAQSRAEILDANQRLEQTVQDRTAHLNQTVRQLEESSAQQQILLQTLRDVSTPLIPIVDGVLAMPLIGLLDSQRIQNATTALLQRLEHDTIRFVLLDVTGVPIIDTAVAQALFQLITASSLLGTKVIVVGVTPEVAQTIVSLGIPLEQIQTAANIQSVVEQVLASRHSRPRQLATAN